jgi:antitoxin component of MazEF toxin-antitoxin module
VLRQKINNRLVLGKSVISEANIGEDIDVIIQDGAIFILPSVKSEVWDLLKKLGEDAVEGVLNDPSENHNQYLYGEKK